MNFVTGGTGIVGTRLLYDLLKRNQPVTALKRPQSNLDLVRKVFRFYENSDQADELFERIQWVEGDLLSVSSLEDIIPEGSTIFHAAAMVSFHPARKHDMYEANAHGTANLVNIALVKKANHFVHVSSIAAIGRSKSGEEISEDSKWKNSNRNSNYAISKMAAEREVWRGIEEGLKAVIVNPGVILGPGDKNRSTGKLFSKVKQGLKYYTEGVNGFIDVRDVSECMIQLHEMNDTGKRYILVSENLSYKNLIQSIAKAFGNNPPKNSASSNILGLAWRLEKLRSFFTGKEPVITKETIRNSTNKYYYNNSKIREKLGHRFIPIEESIQYTTRFFAD